MSKRENMSTIGVSKEERDSRLEKLKGYIPQEIFYNGKPLKDYYETQGFVDVINDVKNKFCQRKDPSCELADLVNFLIVNQEYFYENLDYWLKVNPPYPYDWPLKHAKMKTEGIEKLIREEINKPYYKEFLQKMQKCEVALEFYNYARYRDPITKKYKNFPFKPQCLPEETRFYCRRFFGEQRADQRADLGCKKNRIPPYAIWNRNRRE